MERVSPFEEALDDDGEDEIDGAALITKQEVSHEFVGYQSQDLPAFCWSPWRMLKIDIRSRTTICCDFAHRLPNFTWPTTKSFHDESNMWNHPYMQLMRRTMGKQGELPFCTMCRTTDKRDTKNADTRRETMRATQKIYADLLEKIASDKIIGSVDRYAAEPAAFASRLTARADESVLRQVVRDRSTNRKVVRTRGFTDCKRILQLGASAGTATPYLAENGAEVVVVDPRKGVLDRVKGIASVLDLDKISVALAEHTAALPFPDAHFDGIWLDGKLLAIVGRRFLLAEIKRVLVPGGRLTAVQCLGPGGVLEQAATGRLDREAAASALAGGATFDGPGSFLTSITVLNALKGTGFTSDRTSPPAGTRFTGDNGAPELRTDYAELVQYLDPENRHEGFFDKAFPLQGVERFVSFTAVKEIPGASRHHH